MRSKNWLQRHNEDIYVKKAKIEGYQSRSAFKLIEIENKFQIISKSKQILELGSAPGGWSQVLCEKSKKALIYSFDLNHMKYRNKQIKFYQKNFMEFNFQALAIKYDLILSDISPNLIGHKKTDHLRMITVAEEVIYIMKKFIKKDGNFVIKIFKGSEDKMIINNLKAIFKKVSFFKPKSSRIESSEIFIIALGYVG